MRRRHPRITTPVVALVLVFAVAVVLLGCGNGTTTTTSAGAVTTTPGVTTSGGVSTTGASAAGGAQVVMKNFAFDPASVTIKVGESVTWTNQDGTTHTVDADNGEFTSGDVAQGATFTFTFDKAGTYPYHCSIHPTMKATVVVQ